MIDTAATTQRIARLRDALTAIISMTRPEQTEYQIARDALDTDDAAARLRAENEYPS